MVVHGKEIYQAACLTACQTCKICCFDVVVLVAIAVVLAKATQFYRPDVCKLLGIRMRFFV